MASNIPLEELEFGVDIASYQGYPDMFALENQGHSFVISKATGEGSYVNPFWVKNRENARKAALIFGTYDWVEPQTPMTGAQAAADYWRIINAPGPLITGELVCVDFETTEWYTGHRGSNIETFMREYMFTLSDLAQQPIGMYTATYFLQETGAIGWGWLNDSRFYYWQAAPGAQAMLPDNAPWPATSPPFTKTVLHQHQWHAQSTAVVGEFDRNRFHGTIPELLTYGKAGPVPPPTGGEVLEPPAGAVSWYINTSGQPIFVWNMGGQTKKIRGVDIKDLGMVVESMTQPGTLVGRSIQNGVQKDFYTFPDPDAGAKKVFLSQEGSDEVEEYTIGSVGDTPKLRQPEEFTPEEGE